MTDDNTDMTIRPHHFQQPAFMQTCVQKTVVYHVTFLYLRIVLEVVAL